MSDTPVIRLQGVVITRVQTMADGGIRYIIDASEDTIPQAAMLMECKRQGIPLDIEIKTQNDTKQNAKRPY